MSAPAYRALFANGELQQRALDARTRLAACRLCPRECGTNRAEDRLGFCGSGARARVAGAEPHFGEERPLVGRRGSGTVFFSSCNLLCSFCQNFEISHLNAGRDVDAEGLAAMMLQLQAAGCHNINLVTPTHVVPQILESLVIAAGRGLNLPLVYNTGGYDAVETLRLLDGVVDIYMPDFKFWDAAMAERYCRAADYRERAMAAIREMHRQVGDLTFSRQGIARRGLIVRHLVLPGGVGGTAEIMRFLAEEVSRDTFVNVMPQYRPCGRVVDDETLGRRITREEYDRALDAARDAGLRLRDCA